MGKILEFNFEAAAKRLEGVTRRTPLEHHSGLSEKYECELYFKREDLQIVRSYKLRGAYNMISSLPTEKLQRGVVCASAGNHAQGVAYSCNKLNVNTVIFMPEITPAQKIAQTRKFGGSFTKIILTGDTFDDCLVSALEYAQKNKCYLCLPSTTTKS